MKKIILLFAIIMAFTFGKAQGLYVNNNLLQSWETYTMDGDTNYVILTSNGYFFDIQFVWASLDAVDASIQLQISNDGVNYSAYPYTDDLLLNSASGNGVIRDTYKGVASKYLKIVVDAGSCTSGTLKTYARLNTK